MPNFILKKANGEKIELWIVNSMRFGGEQSVIIYESPGTDGGSVLTTGRKNKQISLKGKLLASKLPGFDMLNPMKSISDFKEKLEGMRDKGEAVTFVPVGGVVFDSGQYIISKIMFDVEEGRASYIAFEMTLDEYRQANIKQSKVNLISFEPIQKMKETLKKWGY